MNLKQLKDIDIAHKYWSRSLLIVRYSHDYVTFSHIRIVSKAHSFIDDNKRKTREHPLGTK